MLFCKVFLFGQLLVVALALNIPSTSNKVYGGQTASLGQFPYNIAILTKPNIYTCSGVLIAPNFALTAAHCVNNTALWNIGVIAGSVDLLAGYNFINLEAKWVHENYANGKNDIALLKTVTSYTITANIKPIDIGSDVIGGDVSVTLTGFGNTGNDNILYKLQYLTTKTITTAECKALKAGDLNRVNVDDSQLCTVSPVGQGACGGDSGGPLVTDNKLVGIVSSGFICGSGKPDIYSRISYFKDWIQSKMV